MPADLSLFSPGSTVGTAARIVQTALAPVFLLNGIGTLLGLFNTRIVRVRDHARNLDDLLRGDHVEPEEERALRWHRARLSLRLLMLDLALVLGACAGAATCGSVFALFLGGVRGFDVLGWLFGLFGLALACIVGSLVAFMGDTLLAWHAFRWEDAMPRSTQASRKAS